jgi:hypothetical protein
VFAEPWQAQAFALAVKLSQQGHFTCSGRLHLPTNSRPPLLVASQTTACITITTGLRLLSIS